VLVWATALFAHQAGSPALLLCLAVTGVNPVTSDGLKGRWPAERVFPFRKTAALLALRGLASA